MPPKKLSTRDLENLVHGNRVAASDDEGTLEGEFAGRDRKGGYIVRADQHIEGPKDRTGEYVTFPGDKLYKPKPE